MVTTAETEATVRVCSRASCGTEYTGTDQKECLLCGSPIVDLHKPKYATQTTQSFLADFAGFRADVDRQFANQNRLIRDLRSAVTVKEEKNRLKDELLHSVLLENQQYANAFNLLKTETKKKAQSAFYDRAKQTKFGWRVLEEFLEVWPTWDPRESPSGLHFTKITERFPGRERSVIRRLNELAKMHSEPCNSKNPKNPGTCSKEVYGLAISPLRWEVGGYYKINPKFEIEGKPRITTSARM